ncbi:TLD-domain-containing protein [Crepidotus variabilis]|uniref:Oxidation resistance protein 1 n=1 Tax=Crepidotus variabilis TaxID=179855 RepID=A0A9P6JKA9_9AGAR|nr:TLD-domain-containing protein [Crepidotus variabilis]
MAMPAAFSDLTSSLPSPAMIPGTHSAGPTPVQSDYNKLPSGFGKEDKENRDVDVEQNRAPQRYNAREANEEKFATLFEPSTPRASPNLPPTAMPLPSVFEPLDAPTSTSIPLSSRAVRQYSSHRPRQASVASTASSEFGAFVEVSASDDPLSGAMPPTLSSEYLKTNLNTAFPAQSNPSTSGPSTWEAGVKVPSSASTTLSFFDTFTQDAKQRSSAARSQVLDELLQHEDDPMWFSMQTENQEKNPEPWSRLSREFGTDSSELSQQLPTNVLDLKSQDMGQQTGSLHDIDHDYFRLPASTPPGRTQLSPNSLRRLASLPPPSLAPPIISPPTNTSLQPTQVDLDTVLEFDPLADTKSTKPDLNQVNEPANTFGRSSSFQALSSMPSKLVSTLLKSAINPHDPQPNTPSLGPRRNSSQPPPSSPSSSKYASRQSASTNSSSPSSSSTNLVYQQPSLVQSQSTPHFANADITHGTSPFAPAVYVPPSGAPGFTGDRYDWDKGFSDELEEERKGRKVVAKQRDYPSQQLGHAGSSSGAQSSGGNFGVGNWVPGGRAGWGGGFGFGFGSVRSGKPKSPKPNVVSSSGFGGGGGSGDESAAGGRRSPLPRMNVKGVDVSVHNGHDRQENTGGMAEFIEKKMGSLELVGRKFLSAPVLTIELAAQLRAHMPALARLPKTWNLIYSLDQHGISLNTLYNQCETYSTRKPTLGEVGLSKGMLLILKDAADEEDEESRTLFGAWIADGLKPNKGKGYAGGGESFLWKYSQKQLRVFKATGKNSYVALCEPDYISFGGGLSDGHYGLYLDDTLFEGSSAPCPTFDNEPLCSSPPSANRKSVKFECVGLEVWGMGS